MVLTSWTAARAEAATRRRNMARRHTATARAENAPCQEKPHPTCMLMSDRQLAKQQRVGARALVEALELAFLVWTMDLGVVEPEAHHQRFNSQHALDLLHDRNRAAAANPHRRASIFLLQGFLRRVGPYRIGIDQHPRRHAEGLEGDLHAGRQPVAHESLETFEDRLRFLVRHEAEGNLRPRFGWNNRLAAGSGVAAPDAVDVRRRPRPYALQGRRAFLAARHAQPDAFQKCSLVEAE